MIFGMLFLVTIIFLKSFKPALISNIKTTLLMAFLIMIYIGFSKKNAREVNVFIPVIVFAIGVGVDLVNAIRAKG